MKKAVKGILFHNNKILIGKERNGDLDGFKNGGWGIPGGHLKINESETDALKREFLEETDLNIENNTKDCRSRDP